MLSRLKDRYSLSFRNKTPIDAQTLQATAAAIPTTQRHAMTEEIESTMHLYQYSQLDLGSDSPSSSKSRSLSKSPPASPGPSSALSPASPASSALPPSELNPAPSSPPSLPSSSPYSSPYSSPSPSTRGRRAQSKSKSKNQELLQELESTIQQTKQALSKMKESETFLDLRIRKYRSLLDQQSVRLCSRHLHEGNDHIIVQDTHVDGDGDGDGHHRHHFYSHTSNPHHSSQATQFIQSTPQSPPTPNIKDNTDDNVPRISIDVEKQRKIQNQFHQQEINEQKLNSILKLQHSIIKEIEIMRRSLIDLEHKKQDIIDKQQECQQFLNASAEVDLQIMQLQQQTHSHNFKQLPQDGFEHSLHSTTIPMMEMTKLNLNTNLDYDHEQASARTTSSLQVDALV